MPDGLSIEYPLDRLRQKCLAGSIREQTKCTSDNGATWVSLGVLLASDGGVNAETQGDLTSGGASRSASTPSKLSKVRRLKRISSESTVSAKGASSDTDVGLSDSSGSSSAREIRKVADLVGESLANGRYKVTGQLGKGSMAYVYRARDTRLKTDVVIKVPKPEKAAGKEIRGRFHREGRLLVRLTHPHIVTILDVGEYGRLPYVVMQLLGGGTLADRMKDQDGRPTPMSPESLKTWLQEVAKALDFVSMKKIVHRDVKPANILFDEYNNAYLSDFGLTKIMYGEHTDLNSGNTAAGYVLGTPNYIAPEIVLGNDYDARADQYSLGMTIYHALIGKPPMLGKSTSATMVNQTQRTLDLLSDVRADVSPRLARAVQRSIEKDPKKRFATSGEFAEAVWAGLQYSSSGATVLETPTVMRKPAGIASLRAKTHTLPQERNGESQPADGKPAAD